MRVGAVCAGIGGLELAAATVWDTELQWVAEIDPAASQVLEARFGVPNLGDLTEIGAPPQVDLLTAGFPCQPVSAAGRRRGVNDERWLIRDVMGVARRSGARWVLLENVRGLLTANQGEALRQVFAAVADHGFDAWWTCVRASDVGAPHRRERWFLLAADASSTEREASQHDTVAAAVGSAAESGECDSASTADTDGARAGRDGRAVPRAIAGARRAGLDVPAAVDGGATLADAEDAGRERGRTARHRWSGSTDCDWGPYEPAIRRWEHAMGTAAPAPVNGKALCPVFVEWLMGFPAGWVTDLDLSRSQMLKCLGNAVVPQQAAYAIAELLRLPEEQP